MAMAETDGSNQADTRDTLADISEGVTEIIEIFSEGSSKPENLCDEGSAVLGAVKAAITNIGKKDIRQLDKPPMLEQIVTFIKSSEKFALENDKKMAFIFKMILKKCDKLNNLLDMSWNSSLVTGDSEVGDVSEDEVGAAASAADGGADENKNNEGSYTFKLATPLKERPSFSCQETGCSYTVSNYRIFKDHMRKKHFKGVSHDLPKVTCLLPHKRGTRVNTRHPMDYICTHLRTNHNIRKPTPKHEFRGFESPDGLVNWSVVFRLENEPNPTSSNFVSAPTNDDGVKKLQFDNDELGEAKGSNTENDNLENENPAAVDLLEDADQNVVVADEDGSKKFGVEPEKEKNPPVPVREDAKLKGSLTTSEHSKKSSFQEETDSKGSLVEPEKEKNPLPFVQDKAESKSSELESEDEKSPSVPKKKNCPAPATISDDVDDEFCPSFEGHLVENEEEEAGEYFELDPGNDSDCESGDEQSFTLKRLKNKAGRFKKRENPDDPALADLPQNKKFIDGFVKHILLTADSNNEKNPTVSATTGKLFRHSDCWFNHQRKKNPNFSLDQLTCFHDDSKFVQLKDPSSWIDEIAGEDGKQNPIRRKEMVKSYKRLIQYILKLLGNEDFGSDILSILRRDKLKSSLKDINAEIDSSKTFKKLQKIIDQDHLELEKARNTVKPNEKHNAAVANKTYFASKEFKARLEKNEQIWENAIATNKVGAKDFDTLGQFARHLVMMQDRNRASGYFFRNSDFDARREVYFPMDHNKFQFDGVPEDHDMYTKPEDGSSPDAWTMTLSGREENVKLGEDVEITILKLAHDWLLKFRDVKSVMWNDIDPSEYFFQNAKRKKFGPMVNTAILKEFADVTKITKATTNTFRKAIESTIQSDHTMKTRSKDIASHSASTGSKYYDPSKAQFRASAMHFFNDKEIEYESQTIVSEEVAAKRLKLDQDGQKASYEKANQKLQKDPAKRNATRGKNCKVLPSERIYLQKSFAEGGVFSEFKFSLGKFPGEDVFKRSLYRIIDGFDRSEDVQRVRTIEAEVFAVLKKESKELSSGWEGTLEQNKRADYLVAAAIRNSFKLYEKNKSSVDVSYFNF